jgi:hypothetical protein
MGVSGGPNVIQDGLVLSLDASDRNSYVSGSTTWFDVSGNNVTGSFSGSTFTNVNGGVVNFNGTSNYIDLGNPSALDITTGITHNIWLNASSARVSGNNGIFMKGRNPDPGGGSQSNTLIYITTANTYAVLYGKNDGLVGVGVSYPMTYDTWVCYTSTYNQTVQKLYRNGIEIVNQTAQTGSIYNTNQTGVQIGADVRYTLAAGRQYSGSIGLVQVYNRALSATEVLQNYNAQKTRFGLK